MTAILYLSTPRCLLGPPLPDTFEFGWRISPGLKQLTSNAYTSWKLSRKQQDTLSGPELRLMARTQQDLAKLKFPVLWFLVPVLGYLSPLYFLLRPKQAPSTMITAEMRAHRMEHRRRLRTQHGATLRRFLFLACDDYAKRPQPPFIDNKFFKPGFEHKNPEGVKHMYRKCYCFVNNAIDRNM